MLRLAEVMFFVAPTYFFTIFMNPKSELFLKCECSGNG